MGRNSKRQAKQPVRRVIQCVHTIGGAAVAAPMPAAGAPKRSDRRTVGGQPRRTVRLGRGGGRRMRRDMLLYGLWVLVSFGSFAAISWATLAL